MDQEFADLIESFIEDAAEHLDKVEEVLLALDGDSAPESALARLEEIKRPLHTLKGNAGMLGFLTLSKAVHLVEDLVKECIGEKKISSELVDLLFAGVVQLKTALRDISSTGEEPEALADDLERFLGQARSLAGSETSGADADRSEVVAEEVVGVRAVTSEVIRVRAERIDGLLQEMADLSIFLNGLIHWFDEVTPMLGREERFSGFAYLDRVRSAFGRAQERAVELRMVPLDMLFRQIPRWVRDLGKELGKQVSVRVSGGDLLLDKHIVERLQEPFIHLIRNAIDHGIESPEERREWGKPDRGAIEVDAIPQAGTLEIRMTDDGRGLNRDALIQRAREKGVIGPEEEPANWEDLIFAAGLSTARNVSQISGRGVGMDIVKDVVQELEGSISVSSETGLGTTFSIIVPLTLAVSNVLRVRVEEMVFGVPVRDVDETDLFEPDRRSRLAGREVYRIGPGKVAPLYDLRKLTDPGRARWPLRRHGYVVRLSRGDRQAVLAADALLGEQDVVLKPLKDPIFDHPLLRSGFIEGDGSVTFALDTAILLQGGAYVR